MIRPFDEPLQPAGSGTAVLRGNLAPGGAVIKQSAASPHLLQHRAVPWCSTRPRSTTPSADDLDVDADDILVMRARATWLPRHARGGNVALPAKLLERGVPTWCASVTAG